MIGLRQICVAMALAGLAVATQAAAANVPLPRPKPNAATSQTASSQQATTITRAGPDLARGLVPRPRPRPQRSGAGSAPAPERPAVAVAAFGPLRLGASGRIEVSLQDLERERDPDEASGLAPGTGSKWSTADVKAARDRCNFVLAATNLEAEQPSPIGGPAGCGIAAPVKVASFGAVAVKPQATLNCPMALAVYKWMTEVVQPAARDAFGEPVVAIRNASSYSCRRRNNAQATRISEHSFGNALDIRSFELASGKSISVEGDWSTFGAMIGFNARARFLKTIHKGACDIFSTVMGPRSDVHHENHFHVDLGRSGYYKYCK